MKSKSLMLFAVAAGCGLVAMVGAQQLLANRNKGVERIRVLVARAEIEPGVKLTEELVAFRELPKDGVPKEAVVSAEQFDNRALKVRAFPGQVIQVLQLGEKGQFGTSMDIPVGMRLVTVPVNSTMTHSGIMRPGNRVDLVLTYKLTRRHTGTETYTRTILEYIQVYAMGEQRLGSEEAEANSPQKDVKNVTLLVTPLQGEILKFAESKGELHLALRSTLDTTPVASHGTDQSLFDSLRTELSENDPVAETKVEKPQPEATPEPVATKPSFTEFVTSTPAEQPAPTKPVWKMEVFQGDERKVYEVDLPETANPVAQTVQETSGGGIWSSALTRWIAGGAKNKQTVTNLSP